ncbi:hypothetical protein D3C81_1747360 [compost metagenome]
MVAETVGGTGLGKPARQGDGGRLLVSAAGVGERRGGVAELAVKAFQLTRLGDRVKLHALDVLQGSVEQLAGLVAEGAAVNRFAGPRECVEIIAVGQRVAQRAGELGEVVEATYSA